MHDISISPTQNVLLAYDGRLHKGLNWQFRGHDGLVLLAVFLREKPHDQRLELVVNCQDSAGGWLGEMASELAVEDLALPFAIKFRTWQLDLCLGARVVLRLNPFECFQGVPQPGHVTNIHAYCEAGFMSLTTGSEAREWPKVLRQDCAGDTGDPSFDVIVFSEKPVIGPKDRFCIEGVQPSNILVIPGAQPGPGHQSITEQFRAALRECRANRVAILSGGASLPSVLPKEIYYDADGPMAVQGERWCAMLPRKIGDRDTVHWAGEQLVIDPLLAAEGYWAGPELPEGVSQHHVQQARIQPVQNNAETPLASASWETRKFPQCFILAPQGAACRQNRGPGQYFGMLDSDIGLIKLAKISDDLESEVRHGMTDVFILVADPNVNADQISLWLQSALFANFSVMGELEAPSAIKLSRVAAMALLKSVADEADEKTHVGLSPKAMMTEVIRRLQQAGFPAEGRHVVEEDCPRSAVDLAPVPCVSLRQTERILEVCGKQEAEPVGEEFWPILMDSALYHGLLDAVFSVLSATTSDTNAQDLLDDFLNKLELHPAINIEQRLSLAHSMAALNHPIGATRLLADLKIDTEENVDSADVIMRFRTVEIRLALYNLNDRRHVADGLPSDTVFTPSVAAKFVEVLSHYLAVRQLWKRVVDLIEAVPKDVASSLSPDTNARYVSARLHLRKTEGVREFIRDYRATERLGEWEAHRLMLWCLHLDGDSRTLKEQTDHVLSCEDGLSRLLSAPTVFREVSPIVTSMLPGQIACVIVVRNEYVRLRWLLEYYRALGVSRFFLIDNDSTDETLDYFSGQTDIHLFRTSENYRDSRYGVKWHNEISDRFLTGHWVLTVDADEVFVYPDSERRDLRDMCSDLDAQGAQGMFTTMIDMYSAAPLDELCYRPGTSLIEAFPWFDSAGYRHDSLAGCPYQTVSGGPRIRHFWKNWHDPSLPALTMHKVPLVRWHTGFRYLSSTHDMTPIQISAETGALLHFKFLPDFHARACEEVRRNQHYEGAREYRIYADKLETAKSFSFMGPNSVQYRGSHQLEDLGLITRAPRDAQVVLRDRAPRIPLANHGSQRIPRGIDIGHERQNRV